MSFTSIPKKSITTEQLHRNFTIRSWKLIGNLLSTLFFRIQFSLLQIKKIKWKNTQNNIQKNLFYIHFGWCRSGKQNIIKFCKNIQFFNLTKNYLIKYLTFTAKGKNSEYIGKFYLPEKNVKLVKNAGKLEKLFSPFSI